LFPQFRNFLADSAASTSRQVLVLSNSPSKQQDGLQDYIERTRDKNEALAKKEPSVPFV
jgi:hypothetical protein